MRAVTLPSPMCCIPHKTLVPHLWCPCRREGGREGGGGGQEGGQEGGNEGRREAGRKGGRDGGREGGSESEREGGKEGCGDLEKELHVRAPFVREVVEEEACHKFSTIQCPTTFTI